MKKKFVMGMIAIAATVSFSVSAHAEGGKSIKEALSDYASTIKEAAFGAGRTSKGLNAQQTKVAQDKIIADLKLDGDTNNALSLALSSDNAQASQRLDNLATIVAAKKMSAEIAKTDAVTGKSIDDAATASANLIANSSLVGARKTAKELNTQELTDTTAALQRAEALPETILTKYESNERDSYTQILNRYKVVADSGVKGTVEESFVQAIMDVKKVTKDKAMEIVRKLKDCV